MKLFLRTVGIIGSLFFGFSLLLTYQSPEFIEVAAKEFIKNQIKIEINEKIDGLGSLGNSDHSLSNIAKKLIKRNEREIEKTKEELRLIAHNQLVGIVADMSNLSCECRKKHLNLVKSGKRFRLNALADQNVVLINLMKQKYITIVQKLQNDIRIFTGSNFFIFSLLLLVSFLKKGAIRPLFVPGILLFSSTIICSYFYIFNQNWFFTIVYNDYVGFGYLTYIAAIFALLVDIIFFGAAVTSAIIGTILMVLAGILAVITC